MPAPAGPRPPLYFLAGLILQLLAHWLLPLRRFGPILHEEATLLATFGPAYGDYRRRVRRWL